MTATRVRAPGLLLAAALCLAALPGRAALFDSRAFLDIPVTLTHAALVDGSVRLAPGRYDVHVTTQADGSVHAAFFQRGVKLGEAHGIIAVRKAGGEKVHTFRSLGLDAASPTAFRMEGEKLSFEIGAPGSNQVLIGLLVPAVRK